MAGSGEMLELYTDGGSHGNPGPGAWAYVLLGPNVRVEESGARKNTTNNRMELTAVINGLYAVFDRFGAKTHLTLYTDSQYVQKGLTEWLPNWERNGWRTAAKKPVKNKDLWIPLRDLSKQLSISWNWVAGHSGVPENERCDKLVGAAISLARESGDWEADS